MEVYSTTTAPIVYMPLVTADYIAVSQQIRLTSSLTASMSVLAWKSLCQVLQSKRMCHDMLTECMYRCAPFGYNSEQVTTVMQG